jgi:branched-chain amino acid aminotransferase
MAKIHLNGRLIEATAARIDPADRGLLLADGLFETLRVYDGRAFQLAAHLARLAAGAGILGLPIPSASETATAVDETLAANDLRDASLRITLTRGPSERGLLPPANPSPTLMIAGHPLGATAPAALTAHVSAIRRNEHSPLARLKSLAYLDNVLALREAVAAGCDEALLLNTSGRLASGSRSNLFLVLDGSLVTPPPSEGVLAGIARWTLIDLAGKAGIPAREGPLTLADVEQASEALICNSILEVKPLARLDARNFAPGPVGAELARRYKILTAEKLDKPA